MAKTPKSNNQEAVRATRAVAGTRRAAHFAAGGTTAAWRGRSKRIQPASPAAASKSACRKFRYTGE